MTEMKDWQHGYDIDHLKELETFFEPYNKYCLSPFSKMKKNNIAEGLFDRSLVLVPPGIRYSKSAYKMDRAKVRSKITLFNDVVIGFKEKGDLVFSYLVGDPDAFNMVFNAYMNENCWLYVWAEDVEMNRCAKHNGFRYVGGKVTTFGEIYAIYFRDSAQFALLGDRTMPGVDKAELINIKMIDYVGYPDITESIINKLQNLPEFTNHYSNYNVKKSWSALSLRGYSNDFAFITKPSEMNDKWQEEHKDEKFEMQYTSLYPKFEHDIKELFEFGCLKMFKGATVHRIRFMRLKPGGGELERHTDLVDDDSGLAKGQLARFHFPLISNENVIFTSWNSKGIRKDVNMKPEECWVLNTKYPHKVVNGGDTDRVHLVMDVVVNDVLYERIINDRI